MTDTLRPDKYGPDFRMQQRLVKEQYRTYYPLLQYRSLSKAPTRPDAADPLNVPVGAPGTTHFDPLWGESVDNTATKWVQPIGTDTGKSGNYETDVFADPVAIHMKVQRLTNEKQWTKLGFTQAYDFLIAVPLILLDDANVMAKAGDRIDWDGDKLTVKVAKPSGYWKNTNIRLHMQLACDLWHEGS